jgi:hypothetical protein
MMEKGVELYPQADSFETAAGTILKHLQPPNLSAIELIEHQYTTALEALYEHFLGQVRARPDGEKGSFLQARKNYTIFVLRKIKNKFMKQAHVRIRSKLRY